MPRRVLQGTVVSDKMDKTVTVLVERRVMHEKYKKYVKLSSKHHAHDEANVCKIGDVVSIEECRPLSKSKSWKVIEGRSTKGEVRSVAPFNPSTNVAVAQVKAAPKAGKKVTTAQKATAAKKATAVKAAAKNK